MADTTTTQRGPASATPYLTYFERYNDEALDPFSGDYRAVMSAFQATTGREAANRATALYEQVFATAEVQPHIYLMLTQDTEGEPVLSVVHRPHRHIGRMGTNANKQDVAFLGDMRGLLPPNVIYFPEEAFMHTGSLTVPRAEVLDQAFADDPTCTVVGPYDDNEAGTEVIATRRMMYLPPKYAPIALAHPNLTPRGAWEKIAGIIRTGQGAQDRMIEAQPLLNWLRVACTVDGVGAYTLLSEAPSFPHPPIPALDLSIEAQLKRDLPGLTTPAGPDSGTTAAINHLTGEFLRVHTLSAQSETRTQAKTPDTYYGQGVVILCRLTYSLGSDQLPAIYHDIAKSPKRTERQAVEERFRAVADSLALLEYVPPATAGLTKKITSCDFSHYDLSDLEAGIHPFCTTYRTPQSRTRLQQSLSVYDDLRDGTAATMLDLQVVREAEKVGVPYTLPEVTYCFKSFRVLLHTLLGSSHPLVLAWDRFVGLWVGREARIAENLRPHQMALVVRWLQLRFSHWFTDQLREPVRVEIPEFNQLITQILLEVQWEPALPGKYQLFVPLGRETPALRGAPAPRPPATPPRTPAGTPRGPVAPPPPPPPGRGIRINNTAYDARFGQFRDLGLSLTSVRDNARDANKPVLLNHAGTEFCLSYHVLGFCWANCNRIEDHKEHSAEDGTVLHNWCVECYREGGPN
jgi:hypothetical protein